jgi:hypothetical protein
MSQKLTFIVICLVGIFIALKSELSSHDFELLLFYAIFYLTLPVLLLVGAVSVLKLLEKSNGHNQ